jgi:hypothetical protein
MSRVRHYQTTTRSSDGKTRVTNRTVRSRTVLGPYSTPSDRKEAFIVAGVFVLLGWPFFITEIPLWGRWTIAGAWLAFLVVVTVSVKVGRKRRS